MKKKEDEKHPAEIIAEELVKISDAIEKLLNSGLQRKTIVVLLHDMTKMNKKEIEYILNSLENLGEYWTTK